MLPETVKKESMQWEEEPEPLNSEQINFSAEVQKCMSGWQALGNVGRIVRNGCDEQRIR